VVRETAQTTLFAFGAVLGLVHAYGLPFERNRGPSAAWWEAVRRRLSVALGDRFDERAGPRPITAGEYAGSLDRSVAETERALWERGFVRNPFARLKIRDGQPVAGSWVNRARPLARSQLHLMLFPAADGGTDVYAHQELSSVNPWVASAHVDGQGQDLAAGVAAARAQLPLDTADAPADPPAGPWTESGPHRVG